MGWSWFGHGLAMVVVWVRNCSVMVWPWLGHGLVTCWSCVGHPCIGHGLVMDWSRDGHRLVVGWSWVGPGMIMRAVLVEAVFET